MLNTGDPRVSTDPAMDLSPQQDYRGKVVLPKELVLGIGYDAAYCQDTRVKTNVLAAFMPLSQGWLYSINIVDMTS